jgi:hypothetical protein
MSLVVNIYYIILYLMPISMAVDITMVNYSFTIKFRQPRLDILV